LVEATFANAEKLSEALGGVIPLTLANQHCIALATPSGLEVFWSEWFWPRSEEAQTGAMLEMPTDESWARDAVYRALHSAVLV
jgi:hypothetical protein